MYKSSYQAPWASQSFHGMPYVRLGGSGLQVSKIGLGTWKFGYPETGDGARVGYDEAMRIFDRAWELGVTFWDTANRYNSGTGNSERVIGEWFARCPEKRRDIVLATKVGGGADGETPNHSGLSRASVLDSVNACLDRLQTTHIDLLYFHFPPRENIEEGLLAVDDLIRSDLVRYFALSNCPPESYLAVEKVIAQEKLLRTRVCAVQNRFNIVQKENPQEAGTLKLCADKGVSFIAWSPLAEGMLTERYLDAAHIGAGDRLFDQGQMSRVDEMADKVRKLDKLCSDWGIPLPAASLAYMQTLPGMGPAIPASSNAAQLECNARAGTLELSQAQRAAIKNVIG